MANEDYQLRHLRSTLSKMEIALSAVRECIVWTDYKGRIKWCNEALELLLGQPRLMLLSASLAHKLPLWLEGEAVPTSDHPATIALETHQSGTQCYEFQSADQTHILEISWAFVEIDKHDILEHEEGSVLVLRDVTQQYLAERQLQESKKNLEEQVAQRTQELRETNTRLQRESEQLQQLLRELQDAQAQLIQAEKMSSLGQLVAGVAHEINNPVSFIYGNLSHLQEYIADILHILHLYQQHYPNPVAEIQEASDDADLEFIQIDLLKILGSMQLGTDRIQEIVLSLRNFSRLDEAEFKTVDLHEGIESTLLILQHRLKQNPNRSEIQLVRHYADLPPIECLAGQLNQVFMNLLSNAIDALEEISQPQITIQTCVIGDWVEIAIADNGAGMSEAVRAKVFNPFFTTKPVGKGTGMGLSISYQLIVEKHHGKLECVSREGEGTKFLIRVPIYQESDSQN
jgi:two-component system NtrC family sensor kinase